MSEIANGVVKLELQGACGTCSSSAQTMQHGLEKKLKERIPDITDVLQSMPEGPQLSKGEVEKVLDGVRPYLKIAGGTIALLDIKTPPGLQKYRGTLVLKLGGASSTLQTVKLEIASRLNKHFKLPLNVEWEQASNNGSW